MRITARPWTKFYPEGVPASMEYPEESLALPLWRGAREHPERTAMIYFSRKISYRQLLDEVRRLAGALRGLGVRRGDRVAIMLPNTPQAVVAYYAALSLGAIVVMVNPLYTPREMEILLKDSGATHLVALDTRFGDIEKVRPKTAVKHVIVSGVGEYMPAPLRWLLPVVRRDLTGKIPPGADVLRWTDVLRHDPLEEPAAVDAKEELAVLQYTGGTTGVPKGAMLTHFNLSVNCAQISAWLSEFKVRPFRVLAALPFFHVYGLTTVLNYTIFGGGTIILVPNPRDVDNILSLIQKYKPHVFPGVPTMYIAILNHPKAARLDLSSIEACVSGAAPLPLEVQTKFEELTGGRLVEGYGLTEASPITHANPVWGRRKEGSIGLPWPDTECRIVDLETGEDVPVGQPGELLVRGPQVMKGYWNNPEATAAALKDGWLHTGDVAKADEEGYFYIVDREKDMIIAGGFNVYPREIEEVLFAHPAVQEAAVIGVPDPYRGETVKAFVVLKDGRQATAEDLIGHCRQHLAAYKVPREIEFRDELPKTLVGKVLRRVLREEEERKRAAG